MVEQSLPHHTPSEPENVEQSGPSEVTLTMAQWDELEGCVIAFHAALECDAHEGGEGAELVRCVYERLSNAVTRIRRTIPFPEPEDD